MELERTQTNAANERVPGAQEVFESAGYALDDDDESSPPASVSRSDTTRMTSPTTQSATPMKWFMRY